MWGSLLNIRGYGYLHEITQLNASVFVKVVVIQPPTRAHHLAEAIWLECKVDKHLHDFFIPYQKPLEAGKLVTVEFAAKLLVNRAVDKVENIVTWEVQFTKIYQIYVEDRQLLNPCAPITYH